MINVYKPFINSKILDYAKDALDSTWISSNGYYLEAAREKLKEILNVNKIILTNNGTSATHLVSKALSFKCPHIKKIICPNNCYVAAWNSFLYDKEFQLLPIDADIDTWNANYDNVNPDEQTAILAVHNLGNIMNINKLPGPIVEDNCEGLFGKYENCYSGTKSLASSLSFFGNKTITSGEGGAFLTNDEEVFDYINCIKNQGQSNERYIHTCLGYNYRMTNVQAAILYGQLEFSAEILANKQRVCDLYRKLLTPIMGVHFQKEDQNTSHSNWMFGCRFDFFKGNDIKDLSLFLYNNKIETRRFFFPITKHKFLADIPCETKNAEILNNQAIILPSYPELQDGQIEYIVNKIKYFVTHLWNESINNRN